MCAWVRVRVERWVVFSLKRLLEFDVGLVMLFFFFFAGSFDFFFYSFTRYELINVFAEVAGGKSLIPWMEFHCLSQGEG